MVEVVYSDNSYCGTEVSSMPFLLEVMLNPIPKSSLSLHHRLCISRGVWLEVNDLGFRNYVNFEGSTSHCEELKREKRCF